MPDSAAGTTGAMKSGNRGDVTTGSGTTFGAHAAMTTNERQAIGKTTFRIQKSLPLCGRKLAEEPAGHVGDDRHMTVTRFVDEDPGVAVKPGDLLAIGRVLGIERQRHPADIERKTRHQGIHQLGHAFPAQGRNAQRPRFLLLQAAAVRPRLWRRTCCTPR